MANTAIHFEWSRGLDYEIVGGTVIRQTRRVRDHFPPLERHKTLYLAFAGLDGSPEACLDFARSWGLLKEKARAGASEPLDVWRQQIRSMNKWITGITRVVKTTPRLEAFMASVDVILASGEPGAKTSLVLRPRSLLDALMVQLATSAASGNTLATCEQCGNPFEVGASAKRSDSRFCGGKCRASFHNQRRGR